MSRRPADLAERFRHALLWLGLALLAAAAVAACGVGGLVGMRWLP